MLFPEELEREEVTYCKFKVEIFFKPNPEDPIYKNVLEDYLTETIQSNMDWDNYYPLKVVTTYLPNTDKQ